MRRGKRKQKNLIFKPLFSLSHSLSFFLDVHLKSDLQKKIRKRGEREKRKKEKREKKKKRKEKKNEKEPNSNSVC